MYTRYFIYEHCNSRKQPTISIAQATPYSSAECEYCENGHDFFQYFDTLDELENICENYGIDYGKVLRSYPWQEIPERDVYKPQEFVLFEKCDDSLNNIYGLAKVNCYTDLFCKNCNGYHNFQIQFETKQELMYLCDEYGISLKNLLNEYPRIEVVLPRNSSEIPDPVRREIIPLAEPRYTGQVNLKRRYG